MYVSNTRAAPQAADTNRTRRPHTPQKAKPLPLEQQLRLEGHQVTRQNGPIGTTEWMLVLRVE